MRQNQVLILTAFEEEGWPRQIDDPLAAGQECRCQAPTSTTRFKASIGINAFAEFDSAVTG